MLPQRPPTGFPGHTRPGPIYLSLEPERLWRRLFVRLGADDELEKLHGFRPGGYQPVQLHDELHEGRYRIIHKLGYGGFSTVWLGQYLKAQSPTYVAIKIILASETEKDNPDLLLMSKLEENGVDMFAAQQHLCLPRSHFRSQSPSGTHLCLVYPVLGPPVREAAGIVDGEDNAIKVLQEISYKIVEALALLHSQHVCHGDFRPSNVVLELQGIDGWDKEDMFSLLGEPETTELHVRQDSRPTPDVPYAPKYLVFPPNFENFELSDVLPSVRIIDFGQSFNTDKNPLPTTFGIPANYGSPEVIIDSSGTESMDLWSLACTIYEARFGERLFEVFQLIGLRKQDYVEEIASILGKPPEKWMEYYTESHMDDTIYELSAEESDHSTSDLRSQRVRSLQEKIITSHHCTGQDCAHPRYQLISETEAVVFAVLLEQLLRYDPNERLSAREALKHPWFHTQF